MKSRVKRECWMVMGMVEVDKKLHLLLTCILKFVFSIKNWPEIEKFPHNSSLFMITYLLTGTIEPVGS